MPFPIHFKIKIFLLLLHLYVVHSSSLINYVLSSHTPSVINAPALRPSYPIAYPTSTKGGSQRPSHRQVQMDEQQSYERMDQHCYYCISFHSVLVFYAADVVCVTSYLHTDPTPNSILSTTRERGRNCATTTALLTPNILDQIVQMGSQSQKLRKLHSTRITTRPLIYTRRTISHNHNASPCRKATTISWVCSVHLRGAYSTTGL